MVVNSTFIPSASLVLQAWTRCYHQLSWVADGRSWGFLSLEQTPIINLLSGAAFQLIIDHMRNGTIVATLVCANTLHVYVCPMTTPLQDTFLRMYPCHSAKHDPMYPYVAYWCCEAGCGNRRRFFSNESLSYPIPVDDRVRAVRASGCQPTLKQFLWAEKREDAGKGTFHWAG